MNKYLIANWKANLDLEETLNFANEWHELTKIESVSDAKEVIVAPCSIFYEILRAQKPEFSVALQDISVFAGGAQTGEVTLANLKGSQPQYTIIGHSERRRDFNENNAIIMQKAQNLWSINCTPIICFDLSEMNDLSNLLRDNIDKPMIMAYEPVTAIGSGQNLSGLELQKLMPKLKSAFPGKAVIYGGSVKPENAAEYSQVCDGLLIGGASLQAASLKKIVDTF